MKPPPARPCPARADTLARPATLHATRWLLALIVLLAGLLGAVHAHGPAVPEEAPDSPSASLYALTPHAIIHDATHVALSVERTLTAATIWHAGSAGLAIPPVPLAGDALPVARDIPPSAIRPLAGRPGTALARAPPRRNLT